MSLSTEGKIDKFLEDNYPLIRVLVGVLGVVFVITSPLVWGGVGWASGLVVLIMGMNLSYLAVRGA